MGRGMALVARWQCMGLVVVNVLLLAGFSPRAAAQLAAGRTVYDAELAAEAASAPCGVAGFLNEDATEQVTTDLQPRCNALMMTNCSVSYHSIRCPDGCSFLVPNHAFSCFFECVPADQCGVNNPNRAFPDPVNHLCSSCAIQGCKLCKSQAVCLECHLGFELNDGGQSCTFTLDKYTEHLPVMQVLIILVVVLVFLACGWLVVFGPHPQHAQNFASLVRARSHRHLCKVQDWHQQGVKVRQRYNLGVNVHNLNILGVGLSLFYNGICFLMVIALLFFIVTYHVYGSSNASLILSSFSKDFASLRKSAVMPEEEAPAVVLSPLARCGLQQSSTINKDLNTFAMSNFQALSLLYVLTFAISLVYSKYQRWHAQWFDKSNATMSDYVLRLEGLPCGETNEAQLRHWLQEEFRKVVPGHINRNGTDALLAGPLEVYGVSICYDYRKVMGLVDTCLWHFAEQADSNLAAKMLRRGRAGRWTLTASTSAALEHKTDLEEAEEDRQLVCQLFEGESKVKSCGEVFVVFKYLADKEMVWRAYNNDQSFLRHPTAPEQPISIHRMVSEPPAVLWWNMGTSLEEVWQHGQQAVMKLFLLIALVQSLIIVPFTVYIVWPYQKIGSAAGGMKMTIAGIVLGNVNMVLGITIYFSAWGIGFRGKDRMDATILLSNMIVVSFNTFFNIATTFYAIIHRSGDGLDLDTILSVKSLAVVATENALAENLYQMMVPGTFFIGYLMCIVMAGIVPFVWNYFLMKLIYVWRCLPDFLLYTLKAFLPYAPDSLDVYPSRNAEKALEPIEVSIAWDYAVFIVNPMVCFCMLFFMSPFVWRAFLAMFCWTIFYYVFCRFMHLRFCKTCYYTTHLMDSFVNFAWGVPLGVVAAAWCFWGIRAGILGSTWPAVVKVWLMPAVFIASLSFWFVCYSLAVNNSKIRHQEDQNLTVEEVQADTLYSWFNCNPIFVLKCAYYFKDSKGQDIPERRQGHPVACGDNPEEVCFYEVGKEYLMLSIDKQSKVEHVGGDVLEFETWLDKLLDLSGRVVTPFLSRKAKEGYIAVEEVALSSGSTSLKQRLQSLQGRVLGSPRTLPVSSSNKD